MSDYFENSTGADIIEALKFYKSGCQGHDTIEPYICDNCDQNKWTIKKSGNCYHLKCEICENVVKLGIGTVRNNFRMRRY